MTPLHKRPVLLQIIQNMVIGGAQRTAARLMKLPGVIVELATYDQIADLPTRKYAGVLLHVWCADRDKPIMNWPNEFNIKAEQFLVFNHDWRGELNVNADTYIMYSKFAAQNVKADGPMLIIPGAVSLHHYASIVRTEHRLKNEISVGRFSTMHSGKININTLEYWSQIKAGIFWVAGDGTELPELKKTYQIDNRFRFPGQIDPGKVADFLSKIDIFLYDTAWHIESFCYVLLEAMAAGCVVVARDRGAVSELISHGVDGFLFESDEQAINICNMLIENFELRSHISNQARHRAAEYSLERFYRNVLLAFNWA